MYIYIHVRGSRNGSESEERSCDGISSLVRLVRTENMDMECVVEGREAPWVGVGKGREGSL